MELQQTFVDLIKQLRELSTARADGLKGDGAVEWMLPKDWTGDPTNVPELHKPIFDRDKINQAYEDSHASGDSGSVGDAMAAKLQLGFLAAAERAFRARHASPVRERLHAAARLKGHGHEQGVFGALQSVVQDYAKHGKS